jgi:dolichol-phosphate mannosyltransferase
MDRLEPAVSVVLPTYNESESLPVLIPRIAGRLADAGIGCEIIVVDDASPDGTADVAERLAQQHPVRVIRRTTERGLATAVIAGFEQARAPICVVLDADGSHPVSVLPDMVRMIQSDKADIVVGSRNIAGGGSHNWPLFSQLKSNLAAALSFGLTNMTDPTTGLMAVRKSLLNGLTLDPVGWKIVLEIVVKSTPSRVAEVPILFEDRELGQSKQSLKVFLQYAQHLLKLYAHRYRTLAELAKFCAIGVLGLVLDLGTVIATKESTQLDTRLCAVFGFSVAVTSNFFLNRRFTFAHGRDLPLAFSYLTYVGTNLLGLSVRVGIVHALMVLGELDRGYGYVSSNAIGIVLATVFNFFGAKYFAFDPERLARKADASKADAAPSAIPRPLVLASALLLLGVLGYTAIHSTASRRLESDDEGVNVTMAANIASSPERLLRPSVYPGGRADWTAEDLPALGNTPFYPALLAIAGRRLGLPGMGLVPLLSLWVTIAFSALLFGPESPRAGLYTALLLACSPAFLSQALSLEFEPTLTAFCAAGLYFVVRGTRLRRPGSCLLGGALLGLGFLTKLWLIVPYALAGCGFALVQTTLARSRDEHPLFLRRSLGAVLLGFTLTASAHLVLVAVLAPGDLGDWVESVYLGIFSGRGITAGKLSGAADYAGKPVWYYPVVLYQRHFHLLPLVLFGLPALLRRNRIHAIAALAMAFGAWLGVVVLSVPAVKEPLYVFAVTPLWYALAGTSLAELEADTSKWRVGNRAAIWAVLWLMLLVVGAGWLWTLLAPGSVPVSAALVHTAGMAICAGVGIAWLAQRSIAASIALGCAIAFGALLLRSAIAPEPDPQRALADALRPALADAAPAYPSFVAPHGKLLMGYLQRTGVNWDESLVRGFAPAPTLRAFVVGPDQLAAPEFAPALQTLEAHCRELPLPEAAAGHRLFLAEGHPGEATSRGGS